MTKRGERVSDGEDEKKDRGVGYLTEVGVREKHLRGRGRKLWSEGRK